MPGLTADLCWKQHKAFAGAGHLTGDIAVIALMPLIDISRLLTREGDGEAAYDVLTRLYRAAQKRGTAEIRGNTVDLSMLIDTEAGHRKVCEELWVTVLVDGARALARIGRWTEAAEATTAHRGIGNRLLDGRQIVITSLMERGLDQQSRDAIQSSVTTESWENAIAAVLHEAVTEVARLDAYAARDVLSVAITHVSGRDSNIQTAVPVAAHAGGDAGRRARNRVRTEYLRIRPKVELHVRHDVVPGADVERVEGICGHHFGLHDLPGPQVESNPRSELRIRNSAQGDGRESQGGARPDHQRKLDAAVIVAQPRLSADVQRRRGGEEDAPDVGKPVARQHARLPPEPPPPHSAGFQPERVSDQGHILSADVHHRCRDDPVAATALT
ncbi:hypothetical protein SUDANB176_03040 [Streptomyces sp. enrichment culture]|uniref:hypothetical protein n=1 Tax=Streptomyces sp. enrichment culture TaxID=1795815 RepID=UPI003F5460FD